MISTSGLSASFALKLIDNQRDKFEEGIEKSPMNKREISAFRERIGSIQTVDQLVDDFEVYSFVMKAYDLESQIFGKGMMKKVLASDPDDKKSLVNKMTDTRFRELYRAMGFTNDGTANPNTSNPEWVDTMVDRYVEQKLINEQLSSNSIVGHVLHAEARAPKVTSWFNVLADTKLQDFFYTALNLPDAMKSADVDVQVATLQKKFDLDTLNDPGVLDKMITRYTAIAEAKQAQSNIASNPILQLFSANSGQRSIIQINLDGINALRKNPY